MAVIKRYFLLGHEVDEATHKKYTTQKYSFLDRLVGLDGVQLWATSQEIAEKLPEYAEAARKIIAEIEEEIGVKTKENQKKTFHSFLEGLQTIYMDEMEKRTAAKKAFDIAEADFKATMADPNAPEHIKLIARGDYERAKLTYKQQLDGIRDSYRARSKELRNQLDEFTTDLYQATPDKIDQGAIQLLNMGIMSADEMEHLSEQYMDNPTMMRVIGHYAEQAGQKIGDRDREKARAYNSIALRLKSVNNRENAMSGFDAMLEYGMQGIAGDDSMATIRERHWDRMYSTAADSYTNFIVQPSGAPVE